MIQKGANQIGLHIHDHVEFFFPEFCVPLLSSIFQFDLRLAVTGFFDLIIISRSKHGDHETKVTVGKVSSELHLHVGTRSLSVIPSEVTPLSGH